MSTINVQFARTLRWDRFRLGLAVVLLLSLLHAGAPNFDARASNLNAPTLATDVNIVTVDDDFGDETPGFGVTVFNTIQAGVDAVDPGGTVNVAAGVYLEQVLVMKSLTLLGPQSAVDPTQPGARTNPSNEAIVRTNVFSPLTGNLITVKANNVIVQGFLLDGNTPALDGQGAQSNSIYLHVAGGIANGTYTDNFETEISGLQVRNNIIKNMNQYGVSLSSDNVSTPRGNNVIESNLFDNFAGGETPIGSRHGIWLLKNQYSSVINNKMTRTRVGLEISLFNTPPPGAPVAISGNDISSVQFGIWLNQIGLNTQPIVLSVTGNTLRTDTELPIINNAIRINQITHNVGINLINNTIASGAVIGVSISGYDSVQDIAVTGGTIGGATNSGFSLFNLADSPTPTINPNARAVLSGVVFTGGTTGISVIDNVLDPAKAGTLKAVVMGDTAVTQATTGMLVNGPDASIELIDSDTTGVSNNTTGIRATNQGTLSAIRSKISANSTGVQVENGATASITGSYLSGNTTYGVRVLGGSNPGAVSMFSSNHLGSSTTMAFQNDSGTTIIAEGNWWGSNQPNLVQPKISTGVDYSPWLDTGTDLNPGTRGFQGDFSSLRVDDLAAETSASAIQEGIDMVTLGGFVGVFSGNYPGNSNLNRNLTLEFSNNVNVSGNLSQSTGTIDAPGGTLILAGNYLRSGGVFNHNNGTVVMTGSQRQQIGGVVLLTLNNWQVNNDAGIEFAGDVRVAGNLAMLSTLLYPGAYRLYLSTSTTVGGSAPGVTNMIVTDGTGSVCRDFSSASAFSFPVGDVSTTAHYSPAVVSFVSGSFSGGQVCARVTRGRYPNNFAANYLRRYWTFTTTGISGYTALLTFGYSSNSEDIVGSKSVMRGLEFQGAELIATGALLPATPNEFIMNTTTLNGRTYTAGNSSALVLLSSQVVRLTGGSARATWRVGNESDVQMYNILRSETEDGPTTNVGSAAPTGSNSSYVVTDTSMTPGIGYYFWLQADGPGDSDFLFGPYYLDSEFTSLLPIILRR